MALKRILCVDVVFSGSIICTPNFCNLVLRRGRMAKTSLFSQSALTHNYDIFLWIWIGNIDNHLKYPMVNTFSWATH